MREVEERLGSHGEFGRVSFARLSFGSQPPVVTAVKGVPLRNGDLLAMVIDMDVRWAGEPEVVMQLSRIPGAAVAVRTCQVAGVLRVVLSPIEEELPFLTGVTLSLLERLCLDFGIRVLGGYVMSLPALGSWLRSSVAGFMQERAPQREGAGACGPQRGAGGGAGGVHGDALWTAAGGWAVEPEWVREAAAARGYNVTEVLIQQLEASLSSSPTRQQQQQEERQQADQAEQQAEEQQRQQQQQQGRQQRRWWGWGAGQA